MTTVKSLGSDAIWVTVLSGLSVLKGLVVLGLHPDGITTKLTLRTVNSTTPNPSLVRMGVSTTGLAGKIPRLSQEELGVVVRKVSTKV